MIPLCRDQGVGVIPYSPLGRGLLAGSRDRGGQQRTARSRNDPLAEELYGDGDFHVVDVVRELAAECGVPAAQIALAWLLGAPAVSAPIVGATKIAHVDDAVAATELVLGDEQRRRLETPYRPRPVVD